MIHIINYEGQRDAAYADPPALHGLRLGLRDAVATRADALRAGAAIEGVRGEGGYTWFNLPPVAHFEAIRVVPA